MTQPETSASSTEEQEEPQCCHHWVIQPAAGPVSTGKCQNCDEVREFKNYVEASTWGDDKGASRAAAAAVTKAAVDKLKTQNEE